jgi:hypothetical protein
MVSFLLKLVDLGQEYDDKLIIKIFAIQFNCCNDEMLKITRLTTN